MPVNTAVALSVPIIRRGKLYESLDAVEVKDPRTGETLASVSQANAGIIRKDLAKIGESAAKLREMSCADLVEISRKAGEIYINGEIPIGEQSQSAEDYVRTLSATSGLPHTLVRRNMAKIHHVFTNIEEIIRGLTRGMPLEVIDRGIGEHTGVPVSFFPATDALGVVLPSNSPGVNSIWMPAVVLKVPVVLKPGRDEPWTPWRIMQCFIAAGCPAEAFSYYPTDHEGAGVILNSCNRALLFGDANTMSQYASNPKIELHGPGYSKVIIGEDLIDRWPEFLDVLARSIADNGGRSCINASAIVVPRHGRAIAEALAKKLAAIQPLPADDPKAQLSAFANPKMAEWIDSAIDEGLKTPGATDLTASLRTGPRKVVVDGATFLMPTLIHCESIDHPLAKREFLFPFASIVEVPQKEITHKIGPSLVVTAITDDAAFRATLLACPHIERLNLGAMPTSHVNWEQPHEGNLFDFLYRRRAIQYA